MREFGDNSDDARLSAIVTTLKERKEKLNSGSNVGINSTSKASCPNFTPPRTLCEATHEVAKQGNEGIDDSNNVITCIFQALNLDDNFLTNNEKEFCGNLDDNMNVISKVSCLCLNMLMTISEMVKFFGKKASIELVNGRI